jgi:3-deoxy-manno-octulosonate cytidylyltransferase (CMP-KDO synthetase)
VATRFPGKLLAPLAGRPVVQHTWERATACRALDRVVIATDTPEIADRVRAFGAEALLTRADHASGTDRVAEVAAHPEFAGFGAVVNLQADEPLIDPGAIAAAVQPVVAGGAALATLAHVARSSAAFASPDVVKVVLDRDGCALYFSRAPIGAERGGGMPADGFLRHVGLYAFRRDTLLSFAALPPAPPERAERLEQLRALWHGIRIRVVITPYESRGVDTPADLAALEHDWARFARGAGPDPKESPR